MKVQDIEMFGHRGALGREIGRPVKPSQPARAGVVHLDSIQIDSVIERHITITRPIHTRGKYMDFVTYSGETAAQGVNGIDRTAVAKGRDIGRRDVQKAH
jgi:hypothetical protein